jgi:hypothetical protein
VTRAAGGAGACVGREFSDKVLVANFGGRCQQFLGVAKFVANSSTYCTYESCPTHCSFKLVIVAITSNSSVGKAANSIDIQLFTHY